MKTKVIGETAVETGACVFSFYLTLKVEWLSVKWFFFSFFYIWSIAVNFV